jgi:hypothetical protein
MRANIMSIKSSWLLLSVLSLFCAASFPGNALAAEGAAENIWTRDTLTGDWRGLRSDLSKHGIDDDLAVIGGLRLVMDS